MPSYNAPLEDMRFILNDVFKVEDFWKSTEDLNFLDIATADAILQVMKKARELKTDRFTRPKVLKKRSNSTPKAAG